MSHLPRTNAEKERAPVYTAVAAYHELVELSLADFRELFGDIYRHNRQCDHRTHYTFGVAVSEDGTIESVSDPEKRYVSRESVQVDTPDGLGEWELYISVFSEVLSASVQRFRDSIELAFLEEVLLTEQQPKIESGLPSGEFTEYTQLFESARKRSL